MTASGSRTHTSDSFGASGQAYGTPLLARVGQKSEPFENLSEPLCGYVPTTAHDKAFDSTLDEPSGDRSDSAGHKPSTTHGGAMMRIVRNRE